MHTKEELLKFLSNARRIEDLRAELASIESNIHLYDVSMPVNDATAILFIDLERKAHDIRCQINVLEAEQLAFEREVLYGD